MKGFLLTFYHPLPQTPGTPGVDNKNVSLSESRTVPASLGTCCLTPACHNGSTAGTFLRSRVGHHKVPAHHKAVRTHPPSKHSAHIAKAPVNPIKGHLWGTVRHLNLADPE